MSDEQMSEIVRLTDAECVRLVQASLSPDRVLNGREPRDGWPADILLIEVERIVAARLAAVETLADAWSTPDSLRHDAWVRERDAADLIRAALAAPTAQTDPKEADRG